MSKLPVKKEKTAVARPVKAELDRSPRLFGGLPFLNFRFSYRSMTSDGDQTHVVARETRFEDGKLESEEFEGTVSGNAIPEMVAQAQQFFFNQMSALMQPFAALLPPGKKDDPEEK